LAKARRAAAELSAAQSEEVKDRKTKSETEEGKDLAKARRAAAELSAAQSEEVKEYKTAGELEQGTVKRLSKAGTVAAEPTGEESQEVMDRKAGGLHAGIFKDVANAAIVGAEPTPASARVVREARGGGVEESLSKDIGKASTVEANATAAEHEEIKDGHVTGEQGSTKDVIEASSASAGTMAVDQEMIKDRAISGERKSSRQVRRPKSERASALPNQEVLETNRDKVSNEKETQRRLSKRQEKKSDYLSTPSESGQTVQATSTSDIKGAKRFEGKNPMLTESFYRIKEGPGIENVALDPEVNINEIIFRPLDKVVFNAPFDFEHITYHMTIMNNTVHPLAFAIKGNCIPRVLAYPPYGVLKSKERIQIAVTVSKFDHDVYGGRDRIVFEWVLLQRFEEDFRPEMLQVEPAFTLVTVSPTHERDTEGAPKEEVLEKTFAFSTKVFDCTCVKGAVGHEHVDSISKCGHWRNCVLVLICPI
uniref:Major sperm protein n=1 Tax=Haemonchus placei TaxID=6290 RepID=A0A0N4WCN8_HAEPC